MSLVSLPLSWVSYESRRKLKTSGSNACKEPRLATLPGQKCAFLVVVSSWIYMCMCVYLYLYLYLRAFPTIYFSYVQFVLCHLYLNKAVKIFEKKETLCLLYAVCNWCYFSVIGSREVM